MIVTGPLDDANAELFEALFTREGVIDSFYRVPGTNRTNVKINGQVGGQTTDINLPGIDATPADLGVLCDHIDAFADIAGAALCGSLAGSLPLDIYVRLLARLNRRGVLTLVDTSDAPLTWVLAAPRDELPTAIKPNRRELELWAGIPLPTLTEIVDMARVVHVRGVVQVIVSLGEEGALFVTVDGTWQVSPPPVCVVGTVDAGNAMMAGVLTGRHTDVGMEETVRLSVAFAACKLQRLGPHLPVPGGVCEHAVVVQMQRVV